MSDFWIGIITGIISSVIIIVCKIIYTNTVCYTQSKYSGKWKDEIYDSNGNIIKRDVCVLKHHKRNNTITGTISRVAPVEQIHRTWKCSGVLSGEHLILSFWSEDVIKSDGCIYAVLKEDFTYEWKKNNIGKYVRNAVILAGLLCLFIFSLAYLC